MATQIDIHDVSRSPDAFLECVRRGDEVTLTESGTPIAKVVRIRNQLRQRAGFGAFAGQIWMSEDFNAPLSEDDLSEWEN